MVVDGPFTDKVKAQEVADELSSPEWLRFQVIENRGTLFLDDFAAILSWTPEQAAAAEETWKHSARVGPSPLAQWQTWHVLLPQLQQAWHDGDSQALIVAVVVCANELLPAPTWCAKALSNALDGVRNEVTSWDAALGRPRSAQKWTRSHKQRVSRINAKSDYRHLNRPGTNARALRKQLAERYGVSTKTIEDWVLRKK